MAKREGLRCTTKQQTDAIRKGEPFHWTVRVENRGTTARHVSNRIHNLNLSPDGRVLEVSTSRPRLAETVTVSVMNVPTIPVAPNQAVDLDFQLTFPLRVARFSATGKPHTELEEWMPAEDLEMRTTLAYGEQPFYPPAEERQLNEALEKWTKTTEIPPMKVRVEKDSAPSAEERKGD